MSLIHGAEKMKRNQWATNYRRISWPMEISVANWPTFFPEKERRKVLDRPRVSAASRSLPLLRVNHAAVNSGRISPAPRKRSSSLLREDEIVEWLEGERPIIRRLEKGRPLSVQGWLTFDQKCRPQTQSDKTTSFAYFICLQPELCPAYDLNFGGHFWFWAHDASTKRPPPQIRQKHPIPAIAALRSTI
jgi:hypothetical protein